MRQEHPSVARNRQPILDVLAAHLPSSGLVLEVASGTGAHAAYFAQALPALTFQPTDPGADQRATIDARVAELRLANLRPALVLDATQADWPIDRADAVVCLNMIHIAPWAAAEGLLRGAARIVPRDGVLVLYGPYRRNGRHTGPGNEAFDADLRRQNPAWGVRDLEAVVDAAAASGFAAPTVVAMPADNLSLVFRRR